MQHRRYIAPNIRFWRQERRLTARQLAERIGVSHSGLIDMELGKRPITDERLQAIADALQVPVTQFFEPPPPLHAGEIEDLT